MKNYIILHEAYTQQMFLLPLSFHKKNDAIAVTHKFIYYL